MIPITSKVLESGSISILGMDPDSDLMSLHCEIPNCLFQSALPALMSCGIVNSLEVMNPVTVWTPPISNEVVKESLNSVVMDRINHSIKIEVERILKLYSDLSEKVQNPSILLPMLPMGVFVSFKYTTSANNVLSTVNTLSAVQALGIGHLIYALTDVLMRAKLSERERSAGT